MTSGFLSNRYNLNSSLLSYWKLRDCLYANGKLVLYGQRIVLPIAHRHRNLTHLHNSHQDVEATKCRAKQTVFWPGINANITSTVQACKSCQILQPSQQQESLLCNDKPSRPFESVSADFSVAGESFLVITDRFSGWPVIAPCGTDITASHTVCVFCRYFREVGPTPP